MAITIRTHADMQHTTTYSIQSRGHIAPLYIHRAQPLGRQYILARTQYILAAQNVIRAHLYLRIYVSEAVESAAKK